jgi:hypothetical protein
LSTQPPPGKPKVSQLEFFLIGALFLMGIFSLYEYATFRLPYQFQYLTPPVDDQKLRAQGWEFDSEQTQGDPPAKVEVYRRPNDPNQK